MNLFTLINSNGTMPTWERIAVIVTCSIIIFVLVIAMIIYYFIHLRTNHEVGKNKFLVIHREQEYTKEDFDGLLKDLAKKYREETYKNGDFDKSIRTRGYYTFLFGINSEVLNFNIENICEQLTLQGVNCEVMKYRVYQKFSGKTKGKIYESKYGNKELPRTKKNKETSLKKKSSKKK